MQRKLILGISFLFAPIFLPHGIVRYFLYAGSRKFARFCGNLFILSYSAGQNQPQPIHTAGMFRTGGNQTDPRCLHRSIPQHVGKLHHISTGFVEGADKQVAQIVSSNSASRLRSNLQGGF